MSNLDVQGLVKRFGANLVVDRVSFSVKNGEFFVLLGPSGGGKTTILRMICGLEEPGEGAVLLDGQDVTRLAPRQRNMGMVFQDYGLYPTMTVFGNIAYGLENRHLPKAEIQKRVQEAAEKLKLTPLLQRDISGLSGGEQQRVALARILARDADVFLYDEPLANLDPKLRYQARRDIMAVHKLRKVPSVYVTHDQAEAFAIADRIAVIAHGRLQQIGTPHELLESPANLFMARFIGSPPMNLLPGTVSRRAGDYVVQVKSTTFSLPEKWKEALEHAEGSEVMLGFQPQAIVPPDRAVASIAATADSDHTLCVFSAEVTDLEPLIGEVNVYLKLETDITIAAVWPETDNLPTVGENVQVGVDPEALYLFDPTTEQALKAGAQVSA